MVKIAGEMLSIRLLKSNIRQKNILKLGIEIFNADRADHSDTVDN